MHFWKRWTNLQRLLVTWIFPCKVSPAEAGKFGGESRKTSTSERIIPLVYITATIHLKALRLGTKWVIRRDCWNAEDRAIEPRHEPIVCLFPAVSAKRFYAIHQQRKWSRTTLRWHPGQGGRRREQTRKRNSDYYDAPFVLSSLRVNAWKL